MERHPQCQFSFAVFVACVSCAATILPSAQAAGVADATAGTVTVAAAGTPQLDWRAGGVLQESFPYHRPGVGDPDSAGQISPRATIAPPGGWYGYGFPVQTFRWGWFGASRYYPRVVWHRGYYDDCCRWSYRQGY
jgi:hypothetical protein